jgi:hypothetical protein
MFPELTIYASAEAQHNMKQQKVFLTRTLVFLVFWRQMNNSDPLHLSREWKWTTLNTDESINKVNCCANISTGREKTMVIEVSCAETISKRA